MQLSKIKPGKWYETKKGAALCGHVGLNKRIKFHTADNGTFTLPPRDVLYEIHDSQAPSKSQAAASQSDSNLAQAAELARDVFGEILAKGGLNQALSVRAEFAKRTLNDAIRAKKGL